jgi:hypothetical protein
VDGNSKHPQRHPTLLKKSSLRFDLLAETVALLTSVRTTAGSQFSLASAPIYYVVFLCVYLLPLRDCGVSAEMMSQKAYVTYAHY